MSNPCKDHAEKLLWRSSYFCNTVLTTGRKEIVPISSRFRRRKFGLEEKKNDEGLRVNDGEETEDEPQRGMEHEYWEQNEDEVD